MKYALINTIIYTGEAVLKHHAVLIEGDKIVGIQTEESLPHTLKKVDLKGANLCAGFIDLQINGCGGVMFNDDISVSALETMQKTNIRSGTTSFLPTFITAANEKMIQAIDVVKDYMSKHKHEVLGIHLEGPYLSKEKKGVHRSEFVRGITPEMKNDLCARADYIKMLTIAPENPTAQYIPEFVKAGIVVSLGHSNATFEQAQAAFHAGATCATHLHNAMSPVSSGRDLGMVGACLYSDGYAGIIADGVHVSFENVALDKKIKGDRLFVVTDAIAPAGSDIKTFPFEGKQIHVENGRCVDENGTLAGSSITMIESVANLVKNVGISLQEALRMANLYPARAIRVDNMLGSIHTGKIANLTAFNHEFKVTAVVVNGEYKIF